MFPAMASHPRRASSYLQLIALQQLCFKQAGKRKNTARDLYYLCSAWDRLEERRRILRGIPLPGSCSPGSLDRVKRANPIQPMLTIAEESADEPAPQNHEGISFGTGTPPTDATGEGPGEG